MLLKRGKPERNGKDGQFSRAGRSFVLALGPIFALGASFFLKSRERGLS